MVVFELVLLEFGVVWVYDLRGVGRWGLRFLRWFGKGWLR